MHILIFFKLIHMKQFSIFFRIKQDNLIYDTNSLHYQL